MMGRKRPAARVVLLNRSNEIFLVNAEDPLDPFKPSWWEIPGGGIDLGEDSAVAAARELWEETGIEAEMGPVVWTQQVQFTFGGYFFDSDEKIHVAWCDGGEYRPQHLEALEAAAFLGARWWGV
ncbi:MAG: NUDIX domain-containing protein, partial [Actinobacteria bacterium]|nr:NUDIX domain-containing protein [Actinomycetota bacterium]